MKQKLMSNDEKGAYGTYQRVGGQFKWLFQLKQGQNHLFCKNVNYIN